MSKYTLGGYAILSLFAVALLLFGCVSGPMPGSDRDAHGCIASAGYTWCDANQGCIRAWEEPCVAAQPANTNGTTGAQCTTMADCPPGAASCVNGTCSQYDSHGCVPDGGYTWCETLQQCIRPWEVNCTIGTLQVYTESFPPFNYVGVGGNVTGQSTEIVNEMAKRTGQPVTIELKNWSEAYDLTLIGPYAALYSAGRTPVRESKFQWVGPIGSWEYTFYAMSGSNLTLSSLDAAKTAGQICVVRNDARHQFLLDHGFSNILTADNDALCAQSLLAGNTGLWFGSTSSFAGIVSRAGLNQTDFSPVLAAPAGNLYIAFNNKVPSSIVLQWQAALDAMKSDGAYNAIVVKYSQPLLEQARAFCGKENIDSVYICGGNVRTMSKLIGGGSTFYDAAGAEVATCPVVAPDSMSQQCRMLQLGNNCVESKVC